MKTESYNPTEIIRLAQNENPFGASPLALKAIADYSHDVFRYPDILHKELVQKLADNCHVTPDNIVVSAGSVALMDMSIRAFVGFDDNVVTAAVTFPGYKIMSRINKRTCKFAKLVNNAISLDNMLSLCDEKTRIVFIANPNNPTGTMVNHDEFENFLQAVPPDVYIVSDEAYVEYVTDSDYPDTYSLQKKHHNLIIFRSFSKMYGLAGLRIGYAIAQPDVIRLLVQHKTPFSVSSLAAVAASAALDDTEYIERCAAINAEQREYLYNELKKLGFNPIAPKGNFILVEFDTPDEAEGVANQLKSKGIMVRPLGPFGMDNGLRITVGRPDENRRLIDCLKKIQ